MKQNLDGKILGKIKIFVQDFVTIKTGVYARLFILEIGITVGPAAFFGLHRVKGHFFRNKTVYCTVII